MRHVKVSTGAEKEANPMKNKRMKKRDEKALPVNGLSLEGFRERGSKIFDVLNGLSAQEARALLEACWRSVLIIEEHCK